MGVGSGVDQGQRRPRAGHCRRLWERLWERRLELGANSYGVRFLFLKTATLTSVLEPICFRNHVRLLANRGYSSVTAMYDAAERFSEAWDAGKKPVVIYLGDHDPSGIDITRDIDDRLNLMSNGADPTVERVALDFHQIELYNLPPNPAKVTDSRAKEYIARYGGESWELDALEPRVIDDLVSAAINQYLGMV